MNLTPQLANLYKSAANAAPEGKKIAAAWQKARSFFNVQNPTGSPQDNQEATFRTSQALSTVKQWLATPEAAAILDNTSEGPARRRLAEAGPYEFSPIDTDPLDAFQKGLAESVPTVTAATAAVKNLVLSAAILIGAILIFRAVKK